MTGPYATPPWPTAWGTGHVVGTYLDMGTGLPKAGQIIFTPRVEAINVLDAVHRVPVASIAVTLDANGSIAVDLPATDSDHISPTQWTYQVQEVFDDDSGTSYDIEVPEGVTTSLATVAVVQAAAGVVYVLGVFSVAQVQDLVETYVPAAVAQTMVSYSRLVAPTGVITAAYTANPNELVRANVDTGAFAVTLPPNPQPGDIVVVKRSGSSTNQLTVQASAGQTIGYNGTVTAFVLQVSDEAVTLYWTSSISRWVAASSMLPLSSIDARYAQLANNLGELPNVATARTNLGLGSAAVLNAAAAATANLVVQRGPVGQVTVPATPVNSTDAVPKNVTDSLPQGGLLGSASSATGVTLSGATTDFMASSTLQISLASTRRVRAVSYGRYNLGGVTKGSLTLQIAYCSTSNYSAWILGGGGLIPSGTTKLGYAAQIQNSDNTLLSPSGTQDVDVVLSAGAWTFFIVANRTGGNSSDQVTFTRLRLIDSGDS